MKKLIITFIAIIVSAGILYAQTRTIRGRVITEKFEPVVFASIIINDSVNIGRTDLNGFFQIDMPKNINTLYFMCTGYEPAKIELESNCDNVEIVMMLDWTYDFITLRKVDKLRRRRFKKLPQIHKEAFAKGLFKTATACYSQEFTPYQD